MRWSPLLFLPAPIQAFRFPSIVSRGTESTAPAFPFADFRFTPHYPSKSPLDEVLSRVVPGTDEYVTEKYAYEIKGLLNEWSQGLKARPPALDVVARFLDTSIEANSLAATQEKTVRSGNGIEVQRRQFSGQVIAGNKQFLKEIKNYLGAMSQVEIAEFEIVGIKESAGSSKKFRVDIRYDLVGKHVDSRREERIGLWRTEWKQDASGAWRAVRWEAKEETVGRARDRAFIDITLKAFGQIESYKNQFAHGVDYWRTVLDGACGIDVYGNNGLAAGDFDGDGLDDLYICQPAGLPNRLYRNRGDGTFEDVTEKSGVGVLDSTACALFADFENKGLQDLLVVCGSGPLLFLNQGDGKFSLKRDAFQFARPPQGTFTHAAIADYDSDGRLDIYFCLYSYYLGLDQYHYPAPYFDARNGPPNFLLHNEGNAKFADRTEAAGLSVDNDRYSFACAWGDFNGDGAQDLYVANDFGRNNLYRNNGDGTFSCISAEAGVEDVGAGMSASWLDFDNDGKMDIYTAAMWSGAGIRVSEQERFHQSEPENIHALYRQHARGNTLYRNLGNGKFKNVSSQAGAEMGRWAWCSDAWDFDHDGYSDLYIANGYITGADNSEGGKVDLASFFWRQLVAKSPPNQTPSLQYEQGWNAINELIRSGGSWSGSERNVFYANNHDGTFSDVSGTVGLDFIEDSRSFALVDLDHDGRLEVVLKNRNAPQIRILRNMMKDIGNSIAIRLRGQRSNRDAIGAAVTIEAEGRRQTKYLQAGSGFLSQHSKELFFGVGRAGETVGGSIRWPSGLTQTFERLPVNHRIEIQEGVADFLAKPFPASPPSWARAGEPQRSELLPSSVETWLIEPLSAPEFSLPDFEGNVRQLSSFRGTPLLLQFWATPSAACVDQLRLLQKHQSSLAASGLPILGMNVDDPGDAEAARTFARKESFRFPNVFASKDIAGVYNIIYRYMFDRRRDLPVPASFLLDKDGLIVKIYQGTAHPDRLLKDLKSIRVPEADRIRRALPFDGTLYQDVFQRNDFTYGVAMFQRGYLEQAAASFKQVIAAKPQEPEAYYNLGTLFLRRNALQEARRYLEQTVKLRSNYPEAWNNLGMVAAQEGQTDEAIRNFKQSLLLRPAYAIALANLGNIYRRQGNFDEAEMLLRRALEITPDDPEVNYSIGMLYARQGKLEEAAQYLERAVTFRPEYPDALNNLGVLFVRERRNSDAEERFKTCIRVAPNFDQAYLNLARLYVLLEEKQKAREILLSLLQLQPQHKVAQQELEMLK
ncbi:MAG TPA: FG-GAP-like repeat-containing protein [Candidatus Acidoferrum sp.]|nr:FG-GAP-like repeat-containing protein [Candidatus Acidoferrum sp.]